MTIERALERMDRSSRELVKLNIEAYKRKGDYKYLKEAVAIIMNFCDEDEVAVIEMVKRMSF